MLRQMPFLPPRSLPRGQQDRLTRSNMFKYVSQTLSGHQCSGRHYEIRAVVTITNHRDTRQDPDGTGAASMPNFLLKLSSDDELIFTFTFVMRQEYQVPTTSQSLPDPQPTTMDTNISGLTFVYASTPREVENLVTREFHADPNLHKNANVELVGDYNTSGSPSVSFEWTWKWKPPRNIEDKGGGWRNSCSVRWPRHHSHFFAANSTPSVC
jgi:hypothetical protein